MENKNNLSFETKICINRDVCISFEQMKKEMLTDQDKLLFCPKSPSGKDGLGMIMKVDFNYDIKKFIIDIYCVHSDMAESIVAHNNWLNIKHKFNPEISDYETYFYLFNHKLNIHFERDESYTVYSGKNIKTGISHYDIYIAGPNPYNPVSKVKRASQSSENVTEYFDKNWVETRKYINYLEELGYKVYKDDNFSKGFAIFPSFSCPHYIIINTWEQFISKNSVEEQYEHDEKIDISSSNSSDGDIITNYDSYGGSFVGSIKIEENNIILSHPFRKPFVVGLIRKNTKSARCF